MCNDARILDVVAVGGSDTFDRPRENPNPSDAVLACAAERDGTAVIDEAYGRDVAAVEGVEARGTAYLLLLLVKRGAISTETARETPDGMLDAGWYCSPDRYATLVGKLEGLSGEE